MQAGGGELCDGKADLTGTPEGANYPINRQINQIRSGVDAAMQEHGEEVQQFGQRKKWTPELNKCVMRCQITAAKGASD